METQKNIVDEMKILLKEVFQETQRIKEKTFLEAYNQYMSWASYNLSKSSCRNVKISSDHFLKFRGNVHLSEIDQFTIDNFITELSQKVPKGYRVYYRTLKAMFQKFVKWNFINNNPFLNTTLPRQQKVERSYFDYDKFTSIISKETNKTLKALYLLDFYTGLRLSEIANLQWKDINLKERFITVGNESFQTKSRKVRRVPLNSAAIKILQELKEYSGASKYVFTKSNSFPFTPNYISKRFKKLIRANGLNENYTFHSIRHSTASNLARIGTPVTIIQQILGHSDIQTTMIYTHTNFEDSLTAVDKLGRELSIKEGNYANRN